VGNIELINWQSLKQRVSNAVSSNLKGFVFIAALVFIGGFFILNWIFIGTLKNQYREVTDKEARLYATAISENLHISELNWVFAEILQKSKFPVIITDKYNIPISWKNITPGLFLSKGSRLQETVNYHQLKMDKANPPLELLNEGNVLGYFHYGEVKLINFLGWMPLLEFVVLFLFLFVGYLGYNIISSEERNILWIALAKETAHQMGTPLSSLMGWMEFLKQRVKSEQANTKNMEILKEMDGDISRLTKVSIRFSQIGSIPKLKKQSLNMLVQATISYFKHRLPQLSKKVDMELKLGKIPDIWINSELMGWVMENLIKNALDSIQNKQGIIKIETLFAKAENTVHIIFTDNGKGIERENWKKIFQTGFSTKKRGWGLGLSLARRIVTIYHGGTIFVEWSSRYHGTQIRVILPIMPERVKKELQNEWKKTNTLG
jgi:hypothetical protein